jgi:hypothetical protein
MMRLRRVGTGVLLLAAIGLALWWFARDKRTPTPDVGERRVEEKIIRVTPPQGLRIVEHRGTELGQRLAASIPSLTAQLSQEQRDAFDRDASIWLGAYVSESPEEIRRAFDTFRVPPPPSWTSEDAIAESWRESTMPLREIAFDEMKTASRAVALDAMDDQNENVKRCSRRDAARTFLAAEQQRRAVGIEVLLHGSVTDETGEPANVRFGITFAWNPENRQWVVIRNCLYDFPNSVAGLGTLL